MIFFFLKNHKYQIIKELWKQKKFTEILKNRIKKCGKTQKSLAEEIGMTQPQVNNLISCREGFGAKNTPKFATALNIDPLWLMTQGEQGKNPNDDGEQHRFKVKPIEEGDLAFSGFVILDTASLITQLRTAQMFSITLPLYKHGVRTFIFNADGYPLDW